jgi:hypothetical protein
MKYLCLGYHEERSFDQLSPRDRAALNEELVSYEQRLRQGGHVVDARALEPARAATTLRFANGRMSVTDGPFTETKEQIGSFFIVEAADLDEAVRVASNHPAAHLGEQVGWGLEVRPIDMFEQT